MITPLLRTYEIKQRPIFYFCACTYYVASPRNYFGFRRATMASSGVGPYHGLWWTDALNPEHRHDPDTMGDTAMHWVGRVRPPSRRKFMLMVPHFFVTFFSSMI
jgi:hypothetical protein